MARIPGISIARRNLTEAKRVLVKTCFAIGPNRFILALILLLLGFSSSKVHSAVIDGQSYGLVATPLGDGFTLNQDSALYTHSVTNADGSQTYQFDKTVVCHNLIQLTPDPNHDPSVEHDLVYQAMQNNYEKVNFDYERYGFYSNSPTGVSLCENWALSGLNSPATDFNIHGAVVGLSGTGSVTEAVSTSFGFLQDDFPKLPGFSLTSSLCVDDSGNIIVAGTLDGKPQDFLISQGLPTPAPEPSTIMIAGSLLGSAVLRSAYRRKSWKV